MPPSRGNKISHHLRWWYLDYYWEKLAAKPNSGQCGWLKDKYGISWQVLPHNMNELLSTNPNKTTPAMLKMKKIIIADLENAAKM